MLIHKGGRLYAGRSSFALPDNCKLGSPKYSVANYGVIVFTLDESCSIDTNFESHADNARKSFQSALTDYRWGKKVECVPYPAGTAWATTYNDGKFDYYEVRTDASTGLQSPNGQEINLFRITVIARTKEDIETIRQSLLITEILNSFQP